MRTVSQGKLFGQQVKDTQLEQFLNLNIYISQEKNCGHSITGTGFGHSFLREKLRNDDSRKKSNTFFRKNMGTVF